MRSFDLVDFKVLESEYFLKKMNGFVVMPEIDYLFSAFVSATRSVTFCMQAVMKDIPSFKEWYETQQEKLKKDSLSRFFVEARNLSQKVGVVPISGGSGGKDENGEMFCLHCFDNENPDFKEVPTCDVVSACKQHFVNILDVVFECYVIFGVHIDAHQYLTEEYFKHIGKCIEDAEEEIIGKRGYTYVKGWPEAYRWNSLRDQVPGCRITKLFFDFLNKYKPHPPIPANELENYVEEKWVPPSIKK